MKNGMVLPMSSTTTLCGMMEMKQVSIIRFKRCHDGVVSVNLYDTDWLFFLLFFLPKMETLIRKMQKEPEMEGWYLQDQRVLEMEGYLQDQREPEMEGRLQDQEDLLPQKEYDLLDRRVRLMLHFWSNRSSSISLTY